MEEPNLILGEDKSVEKKEESINNQNDREGRADFLIRFLKRIKIDEIICDKDKKMDFIKNLDFEEFKKLLIRVNGILRDLPFKKRKFDGYSVIIGSERLNPETMEYEEGAVDYIPPYFWDKEPLLGELLEKMKQVDNLNDIALLTAISINAIHPFDDGNGRTSRFFYTLINESFQNIEQDKEKLLKILGERGRSEGVNVSTEHVRNEIYDVIKKEDLNIDPDDRLVPSQLDTMFWDDRRLNLEPLRERLLKNAPKEDVDKICRRVDYLDELINDDNGFFGAMAFYKYLKECNKLKNDYLLTSYKSTGKVGVLGEPRFTQLETWKIVKDLESDDVLGILRKNQEIKKMFIEKIFDTIVNPDKYPLKDNPNKNLKDKLKEMQSF